MRDQKPPRASGRENADNEPTIKLLYWSNHVKFAYKEQLGLGSTSELSHMTRTTREFTADGCAMHSNGCSGTA